MTILSQLEFSFVLCDIKSHVTFDKGEIFMLTKMAILTSTDRLVLSFMIGIADKDNICNATILDIVSDIKCSYRTIIRSTKRLNDRGYIKTIPGRRNKYQILDLNETIRIKELKPKHFH